MLLSKKWPFSTISISLLSLGGLCLAAFSVMETSVDHNGVLHEPFQLIPIGWFLIVLGAIFGILHLVRKKSHKP